MLIEIHMIQNHSPANLNRDDLGAPKTCLFGGVTRARISSQCLKRSIRRSPEFQQAMEGNGGVRTRRLITILAETASDTKPAPDDLVELVAKAFEKGGVPRDPTSGDANATNILLFVPEATIGAMAEAAKSEWQKSEKTRKPDALAGVLAELLGQKATVPDIALCGRMTELDSKGLFHAIDFHVEAALSAAHAFSTHEIINEVDYFTAVDDRATGTGAAHVNEAMFASACFYKYFCLDWDQLVTNLGGNVGLAKTTVRQFLCAAAMSTPSGKQKSFAASNPPEGVLVEVKTERRVPISYANAFADPVPQRSQRGLVAESIARLGQYVHDIADGYGIRAERFWFSPSNRHPLTHAADEEEKPVIEGEGNVITFDDLVGRMMGVVEHAANASAKGA